jgi:hypothetical protein
MLLEPLHSLISSHTHDTKHSSRPDQQYSGSHFPTRQVQISSSLRSDPSDHIIARGRCHIAFPKPPFPQAYQSIVFFHPTTCMKTEKPKYRSMDTRLSCDPNTSPPFSPLTQLALLKRADSIYQHITTSRSMLPERINVCPTTCFLPVPVSEKLVFETL